MKVLFSKVGGKLRKSSATAKGGASTSGDKQNEPASAKGAASLPYDKPLISWTDEEVDVWLCRLPSSLQQYVPRLKGNGEDILSWSDEFLKECLTLPRTSDPAITALLKEQRELKATISSRTATRRPTSTTVPPLPLNPQASFHSLDRASETSSVSASPRPPSVSASPRVPVQASPRLPIMSPRIEGETSQASITSRLGSADSRTMRRTSADSVLPSSGSQTSAANKLKNRSYKDFRRDYLQGSSLEGLHQQLVNDMRSDLYSRTYLQPLDEDDRSHLYHPSLNAHNTPLSPGTSLQSPLISPQHSLSNPPPSALSLAPSLPISRATPFLQTQPNTLSRAPSDTPADARMLRTTSDPSDPPRWDSTPSTSTTSLTSSASRPAAASPAPRTASSLDAAAFAALQLSADSSSSSTAAATPTAAAQAPTSAQPLGATDTAPASSGISLPLVLPATAAASPADPPDALPSIPSLRLGSLNAQQPSSLSTPRVADPTCLPTSSVPASAPQPTPFSSADHPNFPATPPAGPPDTLPLEPSLTPTSLTLPPTLLPHSHPSTTPSTTLSTTPSSIPPSTTPGPPQVMVPLQAGAALPAAFPAGAPADPQQEPQYTSGTTYASFDIDVEKFLKEQGSKLQIPPTPPATKPPASATPPASAPDLEHVPDYQPHHNGKVTLGGEAAAGQALALFQAVHTGKALDSAASTELFQLTAHCARVLPFPGPALCRRLDEAVRALKDVVINQKHFRTLHRFAACLLALLTEAPLHTDMLLQTYHQAATTYSDLLESIWCRQQQHIGRAGLGCLLLLGRTEVEPCRQLWAHLKDLGDSLARPCPEGSPPRQLLQFMETWPEFGDEASRLHNFLSSLKLTHLKDIPERQRAAYRAPLNEFLRQLNTKRRLHPIIHDHAVDEALALERASGVDSTLGNPPGPHTAISHPDLKIFWYRAFENQAWVKWKDFWSIFPSHLPVLTPSCPDIAHIQAVLASAERRKAFAKAVCPWGGKVLGPFALHQAFPPELPLATRIQQLVVSAPVQGLSATAATDLPEVRFEVHGVLKELRNCTREQVLMLQGPPGAGKWTVAAAMGQALRREVAGADVGDGVKQLAFPGGVWYADLAGASTEEEMWARICAAFGVPMGQGREPTELWLRLQRITHCAGALLLVLHSVEDIVEGKGVRVMPSQLGHRQMMLPPGIVSLERDPDEAEKAALAAVVAKVHQMAKKGRVMMTRSTSGVEPMEVHLPQLRFITYEMRALQPGSAVDLLQRVLPWVDKPALKELAEGCQRHPHTLRLVASAIASGTRTVEQVQEMIKTQRPAVDVHQLRLKESLVDALVNALPKNHQFSLRNLALLPPSFTFREAVAIGINSESGTRALLAILTERGLVQSDPYTSTYRLHPTIRRTVLDMTSPFDNFAFCRQQLLALETLRTCLHLHDLCHTHLALQLLNSRRTVLQLALQRFCTEPSPLAAGGVDPGQFSLLEDLGEARDLLLRLKLWRPECMERGWSMVIERGVELGAVRSVAKVYRGQAAGEVGGRALERAFESVQEGLQELANKEGGEQWRFGRGHEIKAELEILHNAKTQAAKDLQRAYKAKKASPPAHMPKQQVQLQLCRPLLLLASVKLQLGELEAADRSLRDVRRILEDAGAQRHELYERALELSAEVAAASRDWDAAKDLYLQVLDNRQEVGGPPVEGWPVDPSQEEVMQKLAEISIHAGRLQEAEEWCRKGLALLEGFWGREGSREVAEAMVRLAHTLWLQGDTVNGLQLHGTAVQMMERLHPHTPELAAMQLHLAQVLARFKSWQGAESACKAALEIRQEIYQDKFGQQGRPVDADIIDLEPLFMRKTLQRLRRTGEESGSSSGVGSRTARGLGSSTGEGAVSSDVAEHNSLVLDIAAVWKQLSEACAALGTHVEAARLLQWVAEVQEMVLGNDVELAGTWLQLALVYEQMQHTAEAEKAALRCQDILERGETLITPRHPERFRELQAGAFKAQARARVKMRDYLKADELLKWTEQVESDMEGGVAEDTWEMRAHVMTALNRLAAAEELWVRLMRRQANRRNESHAAVMGRPEGSLAGQLCETMMNLARVRERLNQVEAEKTLSEAIVLCETLGQEEGVPRGPALRDLYLWHANLCRNLSVQQRDPSLCSRAQEGYLKALKVSQAPECADREEQRSVQMVVHLHLADVRFALRQWPEGWQALQMCMELLNPLQPSQYPLLHVAQFLLSLGKTLGTYGWPHYSKILYEHCLLIMERANWVSRTIVEQAIDALHRIAEAAEQFDTLGQLHQRKTRLLANESHGPPPEPPAAFHWLHQEHFIPPMPSPPPIAYISQPQGPPMLSPVFWSQQPPMGAQDPSPGTSPASYPNHPPMPQPPVPTPHPVDIPQGLAMPVTHPPSPADITSTPDQPLQHPPPSTTSPSQASQLQPHLGAAAATPPAALVVPKAGPAASPPQLAPVAMAVTPVQAAPPAAVTGRSTRRQKFQSPFSVTANSTGRN